MLRPSQPESSSVTNAAAHEIMSIVHIHVMHTGTELFTQHKMVNFMGTSSRTTVYNHKVFINNQQMDKEIC